MQSLVLPSLTSYSVSRPLGFPVFGTAPMSKEAVKGSAQMLYSHV